MTIDSALIVSHDSAESIRYSALFEGVNGNISCVEKLLIACQLLLSGLKKGGR